jgi:hypothetical protein
MVIVNNHKNRYYFGVGGCGVGGLGYVNKILVKLNIFTKHYNIDTTPTVGGFGVGAFCLCSNANDRNICGQIDFR